MRVESVSFAPPAHAAGIARINGIAVHGLHDTLAPEELRHEVHPRAEPHRRLGPPVHGPDVGVPGRRVARVPGVRRHLRR